MSALDGAGRLGNGEDGGRPLGVGMLGYGFMGRAPAHAYKSLAYMTWSPPLVPELVSIAGRNASAVSEAADRFGFERWTNDRRELVSDRRVDLVDNSGPNDLHVEPTVTAAGPESA